VLLYRFDPEYNSRLKETGELSSLLEVVTGDTATDHMGMLSGKLELNMNCVASCIALSMTGRMAAYQVKGRL